MHLFIDASRANAQEPTGVEEYARHTIEELKKIVPPEWRVTLFSRGFETPPASPPLSKGGKFDASPLPPNWQSRVLRWPPRRLWTQIRLSGAIMRIRLSRPSPLALSLKGRGSRHPTPALSFEEREPNIQYPISNILFVPAHVLPLVHLQKTVVTIHDVGALRFPHTYSAFERWYIKWSTAFALRRGAHILVPSEFTKREIVSLFCHCEERDPSRGSGQAPQSHNNCEIATLAEGSLAMTSIEDRIHAVPLAYDAARYHANLDPAKTEQVIAKYRITKPYFYFQGRIEEKKNVSALVHAFGQFSHNLKPKTYNLILAGKPGYGFEKVKAAIEASPAKDRIRLLDYVPPEDAPHLMAGATAFVFPSLYEGFGIPVLEAMAVGTPVVAAAAGSLPEVGGDAALYFDPQNVEDMASALTRIISDESLRAELCNRGFERVKDFSWQKTAEETMRVLTAIGN